jgi:hypothetical protein
MTVQIRTEASLTAQSGLTSPDHSGATRYCPGSLGIDFQAVGLTNLQQASRYLFTAKCCRYGRGMVRCCGRTGPGLPRGIRFKDARQRPEQTVRCCSNRKRRPSNAVCRSGAGRRDRHSRAFDLPAITAAACGDIASGEAAPVYVLLGADEIEGGSQRSFSSW